MTTANMEDRRTAIAIFLCIVIVMIYSELFLAPITRPQNPTPSQSSSPSSEQSSQQVATDPQITVNQTTQIPENQVLNGTATNQTDQSALQVSNPDIPTLGELDSAGYLTIRSNYFEMKLSRLGGRIASFKLLQHRAALADKSPLDLVERVEGAPLPLGVRLGNFNDAQQIFTLQNVSPGNASSSTDPETVLVQADGETTFELLSSLPNGATLKKSFRFSSSTYLFEVDIDFIGLAPNSNKVWLNWYSERPNLEDADRYDTRGFTGLDPNNSLITLLFSTYLAESPNQMKELGLSRWISVGDKYFMHSLIPLEGYHPTKVENTAQYVEASIQGEELSFKGKVFIGPKEYESLKQVGFQLHRNVDLGVFSFLAHPLMGLLRFFYAFLGNWGLSIVLLTLLIKALFLPLTKASMKSMQAMQELQPEMKALRERIKDPTQLNKEVMALYKKRGVNPMGGCLPMLIQLPVFLGLYNGLLYSIELRHAPFALWVQDLSAPEGLMIFGVSVPVMIILMGVSMAWQQWTTPSTMDPQQKKVMMSMPIVFTVMFIIFPFPAGLVLYWLVNNLISIVQQVYLRGEKNIGAEKATVISSAMIFGGAYILTLL